MGGVEGRLPAGEEPQRCSRVAEAGSRARPRRPPGDGLIASLQRLPTGGKLRRKRSPGAVISTSSSSTFRSGVASQ
jgi:hypothetical protein